MNRDVERLLAGPRGRRCCLELAKGLDPDILTAAFELEHGVEVVNDSSGVRLIQNAPGGDPFPASSLEQLSDRVASLDLADVDAARIQNALALSVDSARYWQEPDGADALASQPTIQAALSRLAARIVSSPIMEWLVEPRRTDQWAIDWRSANAWPPLPKDPRQALRQWSADARAEEARAARTRPRNPHAGDTGSWWSMPLGLIETIGRPALELGLVEDGFGWEGATTIPVRGGGRTFEVRSEEDWILLCRSFPLEVTASRRHDWFRATGRDGRWVIPDWERVAGEWDAVHLTPLCYLSSATRALRVDAETASVIAGWDPGRTIWLTDVACEGAGPRQDWQLDSYSESWIPAP
ncbi:hypothetical protein [Lolliginicoccus levis]|uniref:hypothetical protein n=1 Tax=Lolliginicoccus levis TaxID=2919542 RepID=UPI00241CF7C2|nr:hypothetical protein [Lolliginicoccus levis]